VREQLLAWLVGLHPVAAAAAVSVSFGALVLLVAALAVRRQRLAVAALDERLTHLHAGLSLLTNTTEDGLRTIALEVARLAGAAETRPKAVATARERIAAAAVHGRSVQDIAASEQVSEGEVLLHLLVDKLRAEPTSAQVC
jgi:hypothetical protein